MASRVAEPHGHTGVASNASTIPVEDDSPLAIIGWSNNFPGEATTSSAFWDMLCAARTAHGPVPATRFNRDAFYHPDKSSNGTSSTKHAHFIRQDPGAFDAPFFSISPSEAAASDPQQRLVLEAAYHALEHAGLSLADVQGSNTSVYVGVSNQDYNAMVARDPENPPQYLATGMGGSIIPSRVSWFFDLHGEAVFVDTACSSSLACLHQACQSLRQGTTDMAIAGGVNLILTPDMSFNILSRMGFTSPDGRSYSFDARANGYSKGEGVGFVIVKRLAKAIEDGNTIRAVLRGTGANHDGRTPGITRPSDVAQEANIRATYQRHSLDKALTRFVEAHGTGTQIGDPIEAASIARAFQPISSRPLLVGAVKTNIGHLEAAAGVAGLIKVCMILEKGIIVPNALYTTPNTNIPVNEWHINFPTEVTPWPQRGLRRASLNSFGYGGTNAHAVLDDAYHYLKEHNLVAKHHTVEYPTDTMLQRARSHTIDSETTQVDVRGLKPALPDTSLDGKSASSPLFPRIFIWSASDEAGLTRVKQAYREYIDRVVFKEHGGGPHFLQNFSHTLSSQRTMLRWRTFTLARTIGELQERLASDLGQPIRAAGAAFKAFVFTGQGAQWAKMGNELLGFPVFLASLREAGNTYKRLGAEFDLLEELLREQSVSNIDDPLISQSASTAVQIALIDLLASWDIFPEGVVGHSSGEIAAAYCVGGLDFQSALRVAYFRGFFARRLARSSHTPGGMIAVSLPYADCQAAIDETLGNASGVLTIACHNSPSSMTVSGDRERVDGFGRFMEDRKVFARRLNVPVAYHSSHVETFANEYREALEPITSRQDPTFTESLRNRHRSVMFSSVTGERVDDERILSQPSYWTNNSSSMVKFCPAMQALASSVCAQTSDGSQGHDRELFTLEIGPHSVLKRPTQDSLKAVPSLRNYSYASLLKQAESGAVSCFQAIAEMRCHGLSVNLDKLNNCGILPSDLKLLVDLPPYPFNHSQTYLEESRISQNYRFRQNRKHELLGVASTDWNALEPHWRHFIRAAENPWIKDHSIDGSNLYPASGIIAMVIEAARQLNSPANNIVSYSLKDVLFMAPLKVDGSDAGVEVQLRFHRPKHVLAGPSLEYDFSLYVCSKNTWTQCSRGAIEVQVQRTTDEPHIHSQDNRETELRTKFEDISAQCPEYVPSEDFYGRVKAQGYDWGLAHQALQSLHHGKHPGLAWAKIQLDGWVARTSAPSENLQAHVIHPTALDGLAQLCVAALTQTGTVKYPITVPVSCKSMWISNSLLFRPADMSIQVAAANTFQGLREVDFTCTGHDEQGKPLITLEGWRHMAVSTLTPKTQAASGKSLCYNVHWKPDIEQLSPKSVHDFCDRQAGELKTPALPTDEYEAISMYFTSIAIHQLEVKGDPPAGSGSLTHCFLKWAKAVFNQKTINDLLDRAPNCRKLFGDEAERKEYLHALAKDYPDIALTIYVGERLPSLLEGSADPLEVIQKNDLINQVCMGPWRRRALERVKAYMILLSHKNPNIRMLEIGAGTTSSTRYIMDAIAPRDDAGRRPLLPQFDRYDFTDVSPECFEEAKKVFPEYPERLKFAVLDMDKDPEQQGFRGGEYDVIYCGLVLHTMSNLDSALRRVRRLLKPGGKLIVVESTNVSSARASFVWGILPSWWLATEDSRQDCPLLTTTQWGELLRSTGFDGIELCLPDEIDPRLRTFEVLIATATPETSLGLELAAKDHVMIVLDRTEKLQAEVASHLAKSPRLQIDRITVLDVRDIATVSLAEKLCIVLNELKGPWLERLSPTDFAAMKKLIREASSILWVTGGAGLIPTLPSQDLVSGLGRNVRSEQWDTNFTHLALEASNDAVHVAQKILNSHAILEKQPLDQREDVVRERDGQLYVARVKECSSLDTYVQQRTSLSKPESTTLAACHDRSLRLTIGTPGLLETFYFIDDGDSSASVADDEIQICVKAVGLTDKDLLVALGKTAASKEGHGHQFSGIVSRSKSKDLQSGDRVMGMVLTGSLKTFVRTKACLVWRIDDNTSFDEAVACPISWALAYHCLVNKANLRQDESVLIHDGAGGIGQSAIQIAGYLGARTFVTVGSDKEKQFLIEQYGIQEAHIFSKQDGVFSKQIKDLTSGQGVDVILNNLTGKLFDVSWSLVAPMGRFVEIGKSDLNLGREIHTGQLLNDVSFIPVDFMVLLKNPRIMGRVLDDVMKLHVQGHVHAPRSVRVYNIGEVERAFRSLQGAQQFGVAVVRMDEEDAPFQALLSTKHDYSLDSNATYVVAGGFGGLGKACVKFMVSRGARYFMIPTGSQNPDQAARNLLEELPAGHNVQVFGQKCDISNEEDIKSFFEAGRREMPPIKGCIHSAMMLRDSLFENMTHSDWKTCIDPKVAGTWNLHQHLPSDLDFFIVWSSIAALTGSRGQANYSAANGFQDSVVRYRLSRGQRAFGFNLGPLLDVGAVAKQGLAEQLLQDGFAATRLDECMALLEWALDPAHGRPEQDFDLNQIVTGLAGIRDPRSRRKGEVYWLKRPLFSVLKNYEDGSGQGSHGAESKEESIAAAEQLKAQTRSPSNAIDIILQLLMGKLSAVLGVPSTDLERSKPLQSFGVDSLVALEIRYWFMKEVKANLTVFDIMGAASLVDMCSLAWSKSSYNVAHGS